MSKKVRLTPSKEYINLSNRWGNVCVLCGESFANINSITREHIIPQSKGGTSSSSNIAPSHFMCNQVRGTLPLIKAVKLIEQRKLSMKDFRSWANMGVPNRYPRNIEM
jgi:5-methylcytosine-specific restriction endonuclease McrA